MVSEVDLAKRLSMAQGLEELRKQIASLDGQAQAALATEILDRLGGAEAGVNQEWISEALRRNEEISHGGSEVYDAQTVFAEIRQRLAGQP
jgi:hypothetical protein